MGTFGPEILAFLHSKNGAKISKNIKWPKITFRGPIRLPKVSFWGFWGGIMEIKWSQNFDSGTRSAIFGTSKMAKMTE